MTIFDHEIWPKVRPYAHLVEGRDNLDLLQLPNALREEALAVETGCVACGERCHPFRARQTSKRSRIAGTATERRLFYAATCLSPSGCSRSRAARDHKSLVRRMFERPAQLIFPDGTLPSRNSVPGDWRLVEHRAKVERSKQVVALIDKSIQFAPSQCRVAMLAAREILTKESS